jgi:acetylornithine aminotransferase
MLGTTFGGNHLACSASLAVLDVLKEEGLQKNAEELGKYFIDQAKKIPSVKKIKGRGLMLGLEFDFEVSDLRKELIYQQQIFTGGSSNKNLLRILPPLTLQKKHFDIFFKRLEKALKAINV